MTDEHIVAATQAASVESRIKAIERFGQHGGMPDYWREPLAIAFAADEVAAKALIDKLDAAQEAIRVYVAEVKRAAEALASMPDPEQGYDPTIVSALGYMGDLDPGHDVDSDYAKAVAVLREFVGL